MNKSKFYVISGILGNINDISPNMIEKIIDTKLLFVEFIDEIKMIFELLKLEYNGILIQLDNINGEITDYDKNLIKETIINKGNIGIFEVGGTACFQDPGYKLVDYIFKLNKESDLLDIIPVPGTSALMTAISVSGFNMDKFIFGGFISDNISIEVEKSWLPIVYFVDANIDIELIDKYLGFMKNIKKKQSFVGINLGKIFGKGFEDKENIVIRGSYNDVYFSLKNFYNSKKVSDSNFRGGFVYVIIFNNI